MSSSKKPVNLYLTRLTPALWAQFYHWYEEREEDHRPIPPANGVWVVSDSIIETNLGNTPELIAGCCLYPCDGPYCVVEFVSTNPHAPKRLAHMAVARICNGVNLYGAMNGKTMLCFPKHKGVKRLMEKFGYNPVKPEVEVKWSPIYVGIGVYEGKKTELTSSAATMDSADAAE